MSKHTEELIDKYFESGTIDHVVYYITGRKGFVRFADDDGWEVIR